jgi:DNA adenine methylase
MIQTSCLKYFGGKYRGISQILPHFPTNWAKRWYVEPFVGSAVVFFNVNPKMALLNDLNGDISNFWTVVSDPEMYAKFSQIFKRIIYSMEYINYLEDMIIFNKNQDGDDCKIYRALVYYIKNRISFSAFDESSNRINDILPSNNSLDASLDQWHRFFEGNDIRIWNKDYKTVFNRLEGTVGNKNIDKFIFCDPPYYKAGGAYKFSFKEEDHVDLAEILDGCPFQWGVTYDDCDFIRKLYKRHKIYKTEWFYSATGGKTEQKNEIYITNMKSGMYEI